MSKFKTVMSTGQRDYSLHPNGMLEVYCHAKEESLLYLSEEEAKNLYELLGERFGKSNSPLYATRAREHKGDKEVESHDARLNTPA